MLSTAPIETRDWLYQSLDLRWPRDGRFDFKPKPYGADRVADVGVNRSEVIRIGAEDVGCHIDAAVLRGKRERLSNAQRRTIWHLTGAVAERHGYRECGST
jgi:hypothetical protein